MKRITFRADESLIEAARNRAQTEGTTLDAEFRSWLEQYAVTPERLRRYDQTVSELRGKVYVGRKLSRTEMNKR